MAFKLTKDELKSRDNLIAAANETGGALTAAVDTFNAMMTEAWATVEQAQEQYNQVVDQAQEFTEAVHESHNTAYEEKSETWQGGATGRLVCVWLEEWSVDLEESDLEVPEPVMMGDLIGPMLEGLPIEP
jgi:uncharacterized coiled-coil protein SlyX